MRKQHCQLSICHFRLSIILFLLSMVLSSCDDFGEYILVNKGKLFYTANVQYGEAVRLSEYLTEIGFYNGKKKSAQIARLGNRLAFRFVTKSALVNDSAFQIQMKLLATNLSEKVFNGEEVDIHLCNGRLKTKREIKFEKLYPKFNPFDFGALIVIEHGKLYFTKPVTREEVYRLGNYLRESRFFTDAEKSIQLCKDGDKYIVKLASPDAALNDINYAEMAEMLGKDIEENVFKGKRVSVLICNKQFETKNASMKFSEEEFQNK